MACVSRVNACSSSWCFPGTPWGHSFILKDPLDKFWSAPALREA